MYSFKRAVNLWAENTYIKVTKLQVYIIGRDSTGIHVVDYLSRRSLTILFFYPRNFTEIASNCYVYIHSNFYSSLFFFQKSNKTRNRLSHCAAENIGLHLKMLPRDNQRS